MEERLSLKNTSIVSPELLISILGSSCFHKGFNRSVKGVYCPLMMMLQKKSFPEWIQGCNFHAISVQFSFLLMFSFFEMAMIAIQFCPHSTACLNEPFITNFVFLMLEILFAQKSVFLFFFSINVYHSSCITITFSNYYLQWLILFYSPDVASKVPISNQLYISAGILCCFAK